MNIYRQYSKDIAEWNRLAYQLPCYFWWPSSSLNLSSTAAKVSSKNGSKTLKNCLPSSLPTPASFSTTSETITTANITPKTTSTSRCLSSVECPCSASSWACVRPFSAETIFSQIRILKPFKTLSTKPIKRLWIPLLLSLLTWNCTTLNKPNHKWIGRITWPLVSWVC